MTASTGGPAEDGWNLWSNGSLSQDHVFASESSVISVRARGQLGGGAWPEVVVTIDGEPLGSRVVDNESYASFEFVQTGTGEHEVGVWFDNDYYQNGEDRNLYVSGVSIAPICR